MRGKVYLVGAGPGDPELLTVKAVRVLQSADVVLHDGLVPEAIVDIARPHALIVDAGKRVGDRRISQAAINRMLVQFATTTSSVVRLKGGDPLIFGRAAEEMAALRAAGVEFEVVPGITAAAVAAAGGHIPLTDRDKASAVVFLTAQQASGKGAADIARYAASGATLAIYMPNEHFREISERAISAGLSPQTPCLVVSNASRPNQQSQWTDVSGLRRLSQPPAPTLLIIGEVAKQPQEFLAADLGQLLHEQRMEFGPDNIRLGGELA